MAAPAQRFSPITNTRWLADRWDRCCSSDLLTPSECRQLTQGFVGCNLVMDLVNFFTDIVTPFCQTREFAPGVTFGQIDNWLTQRPASGVGNNFVSPEASHSWQRINLCLAWEAVLRHLNRVHGRARMHDNASAAFASVVPPGAGLPDSCTARNPTVTKAFNDWWDDAAKRLTRLLGEQSWPNLRSLALDAWTDLLSHQLGSDPFTLAELVVAKSRQWTRCLEERNFTPFPVPQDWFNDMGSRILDARGMDPPIPMEWSLQDMQHWIRVWEWIQERQLGSVLKGVNLPKVEEVSAVHVEPEDVETLHDWWKLVNHAWSRRYESRRYAEDLFAYPTQTTPNAFQEWIDDTTFYWI
jgi:hypothetical protein